MISLAKERIMDASSVSVLTGAGISAESGVPTFRGAEGLWENYRAEDLATPEAFRRDPELVWRWYDWRRSLIGPLKPNVGHDAIAKLERLCPGATLITQNVDGLHNLAGSKNILEIHGNIWHVRCVDNCPESGPFWEDRSCPLPEIPPRCPFCEALIRPHIVWFGEALDESILRRAVSALDCNVFLVVGTSGVVQPAASFAFRARESGAFLIEVNLEYTSISEIADVSILGKAGEILPKLIPLK